MNRRIKRFFRENVATIVLVLIAAAIIIAINNIDEKVSADQTKDYAPKNTKAEKDQRMYIPVTYAIFEDLVESFKTVNHVDLQGMGTIVYKEQDDQILIDVSDVSKSGLSLLTGTSLGTTTWCTGTLCFFEANKIDSVIVVKCPAALMARLVCSKETH